LTEGDDDGRNCGMKKLEGAEESRENPKLIWHEPETPTPRGGGIFY